MDYINKELNTEEVYIFPICELKIEKTEEDRRFRRIIMAIQRLGKWAPRPPITKLLKKKKLNDMPTQE